MAIKARDQVTIAVGVDVASVETYYKLQASTATPPSKPTTATPSGWSTTEPTYDGTATNTLYTCQKTTLTDGTFLWGSVCKSSSYEAAKTAWNKANTAQNSIDNLKIGGRNLIGHFNWSANTAGQGSAIYTCDSEGIVASNNTDSTLWSLANSQWQLTLEAGTYQFTIEVLHVCDAWGSAALQVWNSSTVILGFTSAVFNNGGVETKSFTLSSTTNIGIKIKPGKNAVCRFKLEKGTKATDWTPAPEDQTAYVDSSIDSNYSKIMSRGEQLIVNGNGFMGNNTNFSSFIFDGSVSNSSPGSFTRSSASTVVTDEYFPVDASKTYKAEFDVKCGTDLNVQAGAKMYAMLVFYDIDKKVISAPNIMWFSGTTTTLAQDLKAGDTKVYLTDASNWHSTTADHQRSLIFWNYTNSFGYTYPPGTYSRNYASGIYTNDSSVDKANGIITLKTAWTGTTYPAGTSVSQGHSGANYAYFWYITNQAAFPTEWTHVSGTYSGTDTSGDGVGNKFWPGTAYCKFGWLWNYQASSSSPQQQIWVTNVSVKEDVSIPADTVKRTHRIYYRKSAVSVPATPSTAAGNWVTQSGDVFNQWTTKVPRLTANADGTGTKYPYLYTCEQHEMGDGKLAYTTVLLDDSATIIDGGNIITGTVSANAINASSGTFNTANIPNLSADKITSGTIDAARIDASSLTIGGSSLATQSDVTTAVDTIEIGGRNLLRNTNWTPESVTKFITTSAAYGNAVGEWRKEAQVTIGFSDDLMTITVPSVSARHGIYQDVMLDPGHYILSADTGELFKAYIDAVAWPSQNLLDGNGSRNSVGFDVLESAVYRVYVSINQGKTISGNRLKLEKGTKSTDWTPAPEDQTSYVESYVDNSINDIEIGGRNLLRNTEKPILGSLCTYDKWVVTSGGNGVGSIVDVVDSPVAGVSRAFRITDNGSGNRDFAQFNATIENDLGATYRFSVWARGIGETVSALIRSWNQNNSKAAFQKTVSVDTNWTYIDIDFDPDSLNSPSAGDKCNVQFGIYGAGSIEYIAPKLEKGSKATDWTPAPEDQTAYVDSINPLIIGTQTAATYAWTGTCTELSSLTDGQKISYFLPYSASGSQVAATYTTISSGATTTTNGAALTLTLAGNVSSGQIPIWYGSGMGRVTTHFAYGAVIPMTYRENVVMSGTYRIDRGWFIDAQYNSDTQNRMRWQNAIKVLEKPTGTWRLLCGTESGYVQIGASKSFDLAYPILAVSAQPNANTTTDTGYLSVNALAFSNTAAIQSGAANKTIYLKGSVSGNTFTIDATNVFTTVVPTSEDGKAYIPLGIMTSATVGYFKSSKDLYAYKDGAFGPVSMREASAVQTNLNTETSKRKATYGTCDTAADTVAKVVTCSNFELYAGAQITVRFKYGNTAGKPTLNVNNTGAKAVEVMNNSQPTSSMVSWAAYSNCTFTYDGNYWRFTGSDYDQATATNYITADADGIKIHMQNQPNTYQHQTASGTTFYVDDEKRSTIGADGLHVYVESTETEVASFTSDGAVIGKESSGHTSVTSDGMVVYGSDGTTQLAEMGRVFQVCTPEMMSALKIDSSGAIGVGRIGVVLDTPITMTITTSGAPTFTKQISLDLTGIKPFVDNIIDIEYTIEYSTFAGTVLKTEHMTLTHGTSESKYMFDGGTEGTFAYSYIRLDYDGSDGITCEWFSQSRAGGNVYWRKFCIIGYSHSGEVSLPIYAIGSRVYKDVPDNDNGFSAIIGRSLIASSPDQLVTGHYNAEDSTGTYGLIIGNGTADNARSNALTVDWSGNLTLAGGITLGTTLADSNLPTKGSAGTAGTSGATSGATLAVPYITTDAYGRVTAKGTHTHTINSLAASAIGSGTFAIDRLPTVTRAKGGTGVTDKQSSSVTVTTANATAGSINHCWHNGVVATVTLNCTLKAALANGSTVTVGTVPSGYRPAATIWSVCYTTTSIGPIGFSINSSGTLSVVNRSGSSLATSVTLGISATYCI